MRKISRREFLQGASAMAATAAAGVVPAAPQSALEIIEADDFTDLGTIPVQGRMWRPIILNRPLYEAAEAAGFSMRNYVMDQPLPVSLDIASEISDGFLVPQRSGAEKEREMPTPKTVDDIKAMLLRGEEVNLVGVGKIKVQSKPSRNARNPQTGATVFVPARKALKFSESSVIKGELNPGA